MLKRTLVLCVLAAVAVLIAACGNPEHNVYEPKGEPIKIGGIFDLSGPTATAASPYVKGMEGFVQWYNNRGGIQDRPLELIYDDYAYKPERAEQLYDKLVNEDKVVAIQGWGTGDTELLQARAAKDKIPYLSAAYAIELANPQTAPYNFMVGASYSDQLLMALEWIKGDATQKGVAPSVVVFHSDSPFGRSPLADGEAYAQANGITFSAIPMSDLAPAALEANLNSAQEQGATYAIIQNTPLPASLLVREAQAAGALEEMQFICLNWCADELFVKMAVGAAEGVMGIQPFSPDLATPGAEDAAEFLHSKGSLIDDLGLRYLQGWWTMAVLTEGIKRTVEAGQPLTGENVRASLESLQGFSTGDVTGPLTFSAADHRGLDTAKLYEVRSDAWRPVSEALRSRVPLAP